MRILVIRLYFAFYADYMKKTIGQMGIVFLTMLRVSYDTPAVAAVILRACLALRLYLERSTEFCGMFSDTALART